MMNGVLALALLAANSPGPRDGASAHRARKSTVLVMHLVAREGASQSNGAALGQLLGSALAERKELDVTGYEPAVYSGVDPLVGVLARCEETRCAMELGQRLGFSEVLVGSLSGPDPSELHLVRISAEDGRVVSTYTSTLTDAELANVTGQPERVLDQLFPPHGAQPAVAGPPPRANPKTPFIMPGAPGSTGRERVEGGPAWRPWARLAGAAGMGAALAGTGAALMGVAAYNVVVVADFVQVTSTGRHAFTRPMASLLDLGFVVFMVAALWVFPVGAAAATALAASWWVP